MSEALNITQMLRQWSDGNHSVLDDLLPLIYGELHRQAARYLRRERPEHTLQTTALINEVYLKLIDSKEMTWESRTHFFAIAAKLMRQILVDYARTRNREKRDGNLVRLSLTEVGAISGKERNIDLIALDEALSKLEKRDQRQARIVELRYFADLTLEETAETLKISRTTVADDWAMAKSWLHREMTR
jgi:RNA polymerase sigma factor (TIGR02999 family)